MTIKDGNTTYKGVKENADGIIVCEKCGTSGIKLVCHMDGKDFYMNQYECAECGNAISAETKRTKADARYWE